MGSVFLLGYPLTLPRALGGGGWGLSKDHVIYQFLGTINSGDFKSETSFSFRIPSDPPKGVLGGGVEGGWDLYTTKDNEINQF